MKKRRSWRLTFWQGFKVHWFNYRGFQQANFSILTNAVVSVIVIVLPLYLVIRVSFAFLASKAIELLWRSLIPVWMPHGKRHLSDCSLNVQSSLLIFLTERLHNFDKTWFLNYFLLHNKQKRVENGYFSKNSIDCKKASIQSDQNHIPFQRSRAVNGLTVVTYPHKILYEMSVFW